MYCLSVIILIFIIQVPGFVQWQASQTLEQQNLAPIQTRMTGHTIIIVLLLLRTCPFLPQNSGFKRTGKCKYHFKFLRIYFIYVLQVTIYVKSSNVKCLNKECFAVVSVSIMLMIIFLIIGGPLTLLFTIPGLVHLTKVCISL